MCEHFYESFEYVMYVLEVTAHNLHHDDCPDQFYGCWNTATKRDASGLLQAIRNFEFVVTFVIGYLYLSHMSALTTKLQGKSNEIFKAFTMVSSVLKSYQDMRADMDEMYDDVYEKAIAMAAKVGVAGRQRHRANAPAPTAKEYYRINVAAPFLDHIILQLGERFHAVTVQASRLLALVPSVMNENQTKSQELQGVVEIYRDDLPSPQLFPTELWRWRIKYAEEEELPDSCATALKQCDVDEFPNIFTLLKILSTLPVTSCE